MTDSMTNTVERSVPDDVGNKARAGNPRALLIADALYLLLVFGWMLFLPPPGRDYAALANPDLLGPVPGRLFSGMMHLFNGHVSLYYLVNLILLYLCMVTLLILARTLGKGPWWLGSVAAVLFMANPVKTEAILSLGGIQFLLPGLTGLTVLLVYAVCRKGSGVPSRWLPLFAYTASILACPDTIPVFLVLVVLEWCFFQKIPGKRERLWPIVILGVLAFLVSGQWAFAGALRPANMFAPLYLVLYPIGMLPDTVASFSAWPLLGWACALLLVATAVWLMRRARDPLITFGLLGAAAFRLLQGSRPVDPVTLSGGGALLIPAALLSLAACAGFHVMMRHPRWRSSVVRTSTLLCVAAMLCQGWVNWNWLQTGLRVSRFQETAAETAARYPDQALAVAPDVLYIGTVPAMLSESVRYNTPFSAALPVVALMPLSLLPPAEINVLSYSPAGMTVSVTGLNAPSESSSPLFSRAWWQQRRCPRKAVPLELTAGPYPLPEVRITSE